jgi:hypothetical protein
MKKRGEVTQTYPERSAREEGTGPDSAGQSGDDQGLSGVEESNSESVLELVEEGQYLEAATISGVEEASDPDTPRRVRTRQVREDDVPPEYLPDPDSGSID